MANIKILLAEDDSNLGFVIKDNLGDRGYDITHCLNGLDAEHATYKDKYDLYLLDVMMPGMDGFAFLEEFDKLQNEIKSKSKVIMLSTSESFKDLNRANQSRYVYKFLNKPLNKPVLDAINI